jgi:nitrate/TMAO reductase-like tetraheme cytochrome c subunit
MAFLSRSFFADSSALFKKKEYSFLNKHVDTLHLVHGNGGAPIQAKKEKTMSSGTRLGKWMFFGVIAAIAIFFMGALAIPWMQRNRDRPGRAFSDKKPDDFTHPVVIRKPKGTALVDSGKKDMHGQAVMVACATCHDTRDPNFKSNSGESLKEFHQGLKTRHGEQTCLSCHNPQDYNTLKRADGRSLGLYESMQLCAQCHGPQYRDYQNGSHGGMTGHWDLKQGPRERNHCTDCHDPHHPQYPLVMPVFPPKPVIGEAVRSVDKAHPH